MKENINFGFLLIVIIIYLVGVNVYYQVKYNNIYSSYKDKVDELKNISLTLENERNRLNITGLQLVKKGSYPILSNLTWQITSKMTELNQIKEEADQVQSKLLKIKIYNVIFIFAAFAFFSINRIRRIMENRKSI